MKSTSRAATIIFGIVLMRAFIVGIVMWVSVRSLAAQPPIDKKPAAAPKVVAPKRVPWTTSKIVGTPEPPHPYKAERVFPKLSFRDPIFMVRAPGIERWFVGEQRGRIVSFPKDNAIEKADVFCDFPAEVKSWDPASNVRRIEACYALVFHPQFPKKRTCYVCYVLESKKGGEQLPDGSRISEFAVTDADPPRIDVKSERILLTFLAGGHNGCDMHFGNDGMLYISTGDATDPNPPDKFDTGQDLSDLLSSILRIDVDKKDPGREYAIPKDNPFVGLPKTRGENWAYGFRNPWRMSFDRATGDLWVGDVGWELYEMIYRVQKGGNYGWSVKEGPQDVRPDAKRGPTPILPPTIAFPHTDAASITGGFVYHGKKFPELEGAYICGDWVSRKVWASRFEKDKIVSHKEIAQTNARIVAFGEDADGELYIVDHLPNGGIYTLVPDPAAKEWKDTFPRKLSETGLFAATTKHALAPGVRYFGTAVPAWIDDAYADRFVAFPGLEKAKMYEDYVRIEDEFWGSHLFPPKNAVLGKTIWILLDDKRPLKRLETQILHNDGGQWRGYTYVWKEDQTDAILLDAKGKDITLTRVHADGKPKVTSQTWHFASRTECITCHNPWAGFTLAFNPLQLSDPEPANDDGDELHSLAREGFIDLLRKKNGKDYPWDGSIKNNPFRFNGHSSDWDHGERWARRYLHANCAHCHQPGAGGTADLDLRATTPLEKTNTVDVRPIQGGFDIPNAKIITPGHPFRSTLYYRVSMLGRGRMPHIGSDVVDHWALERLGQWIRNMSPDPKERALFRRLHELDDSTHDNLGNEEFKAKTGERAKIIANLLDSPETALKLVHAVKSDYDSPVVESKVAPEIVKLALAHPNPLIRSLFERFAAPGERIERLGANIDEQKLLALSGDAARGRDLFFSPVFQCGQCHQVAKKGGQVGPDLSDVAKRLSKTQIIESLLTPSKTIEPKYLTHAVETSGGKIVTGLLVEKTAKEMVLRVVGDKEVRIPLAEIDNTQTLKTSLMPDNLLRDATPRQAGDLLAYLWSLK
jgi:putative heme-binding domain-containing protein